MLWYGATHHPSMGLMVCVRLHSAASRVFTQLNVGQKRNQPTTRTQLVLFFFLVIVLVMRMQLTTSMLRKTCVLAIERECVYFVPLDFLLCAHFSEANHPFPPI